MVQSLPRLSKEGADDCRFGDAIISREFCQLFDVTVHWLNLPPLTSPRRGGDERGGVAPNESPRRHRNYRAAIFARAEFFVAGELLVDLAYGIGAVVADFGGSFVDFLAAFIAEPFEVIDFPGFALALEDYKPGVGLEPRRVGHAGRTEQDLAGFDISGVFFASFVTVNEMLHAG